MVKFTGSFQSPLEFGHVIVISGIARKTAENFFINFLGDKASGDIPLHLNVVFGENEQIIRNTKINGEFGAAETSPGMFTKERNPLKSGDRFTFYILIGLDRFHISINSIHFCDYIFRASVKRIQSCQVVRDVDRIIQFDHRRTFPFTYPVAQSRLPPHLVFSNDIPAPFKEGSVLVIKGSTGGNPNGAFRIKFYVGKSEKQAFTFDVRFSQQKVARNNCVNDMMFFVEDEEETYGGFPFDFEKIFKIAFGFEHQGVRVSVNGKFFCEYPYTAKLVQYSGMKISERSDLRLHVMEVHHFRIEKDLHHLDVFSKLE
ncbi:galectin-9-like isoform X2 [Chironomus tepperi]|uniref:galectin-9-like isoform X2 n=1 Tax=Chironomus tepperi TaxID=113505 RepID=UPI00391FA8AC